MFIDTFYNYLVSQYKAAQIMKELYNLSDRELRELNISRHEIPSLAYDATKNRN